MPNTRQPSPFFHMSTLLFLMLQICCTETASLDDRACSCITGFKCCVMGEASRCIPESQACTVTIPAGKFWMGSPGGGTLDNEPALCPQNYPGLCERDAGRFSVNRLNNSPSSNYEDLHQVQLTHSFAMMVNEVTGPYFDFIMGFDPSINPRSEAGRDMDDDWPVDQVTWFDAIAFANRLSEREGYPTCYRLDSIECSYSRGLAGVSATLEDCQAKGGQIRNAKVSVIDGANVYACRGYRLPTEAEWEYAARAGTLTPYYNGGPEGDRLREGVDTKLQEIAWYDESWDGTYPSGSMPVRKKQANAFGLYDMLGNLWEWVWDTYSPHYPIPTGGTVRIDPVVWEEKPEQEFLLRGGGWASWWSYCRSAQRYSTVGRDTLMDRDSRSSRGFRLVRTLHDDVLD